MEACNCNSHLSLSYLIAFVRVAHVSSVLRSSIVCVLHFRQLCELPFREQAPFSLFVLVVPLCEPATGGPSDPLTQSDSHPHLDHNCPESRCSIVLSKHLTAHDDEFVD